MTERAGAGQRRPLIAAHRGGALLFPENSLTAFHGALTFDVDQIETDVRLSADGEPFLLHDATLDRTTDAAGLATALPFSALRAIRLTGTEGDTIPHLDALVDLLRPTRVDLRLELKAGADGAPQPGLAAKALERLAAKGMTERTTLTSFDRRYFAETRAAPVAGRLWLVRRDEADASGLSGLLARAADDGIDEIALPRDRAGLLAEDCDRRGVDVGLYGVNDSEAIEAAFRLGASAFTTDRPDLAVAFRTRRTS